MTCETFDVDGGIAIVCSRGRGRADRPCQKCGATSTRLCDFKLTGRRAGKTCDAPLCDRCAVCVGVMPDRETVDMCPTHARFRETQIASAAERARPHAEREAERVRVAEVVDRLESIEAERWLAHVRLEEETEEARSWCANEFGDRWFEISDHDRNVIADFARELRGEVRTVSGEPWRGNETIGTVDGAASWNVDRPEVDPRAELAHAEPVASKVAHVKRAGQTRAHGCHWPGCDAQCPPAMWGCRRHWFRLPKRLRDKIWGAYRSGQEATLTPSREYLAVADEVERWILEHGGVP